MQIDEVVWQVINNGHCSFKVKTVAQTFCRNEYNVTGLCSRQSCPLANSQYATIKEEKGLCYLFVKTAERAQKPNELWEKILLSKNYDQALEQIDKELQYWSNFQVHKNKQRLTKLRQMLIRMRKMRIKGFKELIPIKKKAERRDKIRESKALIAANLEDTIEKELIERLKHGVYDGVVNYNFKAFNKILDDNRIEDDVEREQNELEEEEEDYSEEELIFDPEDLEADSDEEVAEDDKPFNFAKARKTKLQYEQEDEDEGPRRKHKATDF